MNTSESDTSALTDLPEHSAEEGSAATDHAFLAGSIYCAEEPDADTGAGSAYDATVGGTSGSAYDATVGGHSAGGLR